MSEMVSGPVLALLAEIDRVTREVIDRHWDADKKTAMPTLVHYGPFGVHVTSVDGVLASFMEEGINLYPDVELVRVGKASKESN